MTEIAVELLTTIIGSIGITILFAVQPRRIPFAVLGALITCAAYLLLLDVWDNVFACSLVGGMISAIYSEVMARILKTPVTIMLLPSIIPLVPGGNLYYTMSNLVFGNQADMTAYATKTVLIAVGIAVGILMISIISNLLMPLYRYLPFLQKDKPCDR